MYGIYNMYTYTYHTYAGKKRCENGCLKKHTHTLSVYMYEECMYGSMYAYMYMYECL